MKTALIALALGFTPAVALAQYYPGTPQDTQTHPNIYSTQTNPDGSSTTRGSNPYTGSQWSSQRQPNGDQSGVNSQGQRWTYDNSTKTYDNPQAGQRCITSATGQRICT